jgi:hypothetical protein
MIEKDESLPATIDDHRPAGMMLGGKGLRIETLAEANEFARGIVESGMAPKGMKAGGVVALIEAGKELGLPPMFAINGLTFINNRLGMMGDTARALILASKKLREGTRIEVWYEGEEYEDDFRCTVTTHRREEVEPVSHSFSVRDAKTAALWKKPGPWTNYPKRMLMYRALGFHVRDQYPDVMMGTALKDELEDIPIGPKGRPERDVTPPKEAPEGKDPLLEQAAESVGKPTSGANTEAESPEGPGADDAGAATPEERVDANEPEDAEIIEPQAPEPEKKASTPEQDFQLESPPDNAEAPLDMPRCAEGEHDWMDWQDLRVCNRCGEIVPIVGEQIVKDEKGRL